MRFNDCSHVQVGRADLLTLRRPMDGGGFGVRHQVRKGCTCSPRTNIALLHNVVQANTSDAAQIFTHSACTCRSFVAPTPVGCASNDWLQKSPFRSCHAEWVSTAIDRNHWPQSTFIRSKTKLDRRAAPHAGKHEFVGRSRARIREQRRILSCSCTVNTDDALVVAQLEWDMPFLLSH